MSPLQKEVNITLPDVTNHRNMDNSLLPYLAPALRAIKENTDLVELFKKIIFLK